MQCTENGIRKRTLLALLSDLWTSRTVSNILTTQYFVKFDKISKKLEIKAIIMVMATLQVKMELIFPTSRRNAAGH